MGGKLSYPQDEIPADKTYIVTGGNTGIGYETAKRIAKLGGRVIIACRSEERAKEALEKMQKEHKEEIRQEQNALQDAAEKNQQAPPTKDTPKPSVDTDTPGEASATKDTSSAAEDQTSEVKEPVAQLAEDDADGDIQPLKVEFMKLDLSSLTSTMEFINAYKAKGYPLHVLICNAGIGLVPYTKTDDGYELQFQVNYLSHFLITLHLLPLLRESAPNSRIINVSSMMHSAGSFDLKNMQAELSYDRIKFYGNSKVYQIMSMYALTHRLKSSGISIFSVHPGYVESEFTRGSADSKFHSFVDSASQLLRLKRNTEEGSFTSLVAALDSAYDGSSGMYFKDCKVSTPSGLARNKEKQEQLWDYTLDCLKDHITEEVLKDLQLPVPAGQDDSSANGETNATASNDSKEEAESTQDEKATNNSKEEAAASQDETKSEQTKTNTEAESKVEEKSESKPEEEESPGDGDEASKPKESDSNQEEDNQAKPEVEAEVKEENKEEKNVEEDVKKEENKEEAESEDQSQSW